MQVFFFTKVHYYTAQAYIVVAHDEAEALKLLAGDKPQEVIYHPGTAVNYDQIYTFGTRLTQLDLTTPKVILLEPGDGRPRDVYLDTH